MYLVFFFKNLDPKNTILDIGFIFDVYLLNWQIIATVPLTMCKISNLGIRTKWAKRCKMFDYSKSRSVVGCRRRRDTMVTRL